MDEALVNAPRRSPWRVIVAVIAVAAIAVIVFFVAGYFKETEDDVDTGSGSAVAIPSKVLANQFGFLGGGGADLENTFVGDVGAAWVRPHPGPFLWDAMQEKAGGEIDFSATDKLVTAQQDQSYGTLVTLWPFAEWDQTALANAANCTVSENDEFLPKNDKKGRGDYLPSHRCAPSDWEKYGTWVKSVVERYDGDGQDDMPGLSIPIKYWEVMNEPDLQTNAKSSLSFWQDTPANYAKLLVETSAAIKEADPNAQVLIAGAAGGSSDFLNFYRKVLAIDGATSAFDIGNVHCISNDEKTRDFNVGVYKAMLAEFGITKPIWVTEAEAFYGQTAEDHYDNTKQSTAGAIATGATRIFYTRYSFDDFRTDMSEKTNTTNAEDNEKKYSSIISAH